MVEIIPAIIPKSLDDLKKRMASVADLAPLVQIDITDGAFVPEKNWPYVQGGPQEFSRFVREEEPFPFSDSLDFSVDLMVSRPESVIDDWMHAGARRVIVHIESTQNMQGSIDMLRAQFTGGGAFDVTGAEFGIALNPETPNDMLKPFIGSVDFVQCMGIERIGFQGQPFDERVVEKVADLHERHPELIISVDGGVSIETAPRLVEAGASRLAVGSAIFENDNVKTAIENLKTAVSIS